MVFQFLIFDFQILLRFYCLFQFPDAVQQRFSMPQFHIMKFLILYQFPQKLHIRFIAAQIDQLVNNRIQFLFCECPALQQYFCNDQKFFFFQLCLFLRLKYITTQSLFKYNFLNFSGCGGMLLQKTLNIYDITLNGSFRYPVTDTLFLLINHFSLLQSRIYRQNTSCFIF